MSNPIWLTVLAWGLASHGLWAQQVPLESAPQRDALASRPVRTRPLDAAQTGFRRLVGTLLKGNPHGGLPPSFPFDVKDMTQLREAEIEGGYEIHTVDPSALLVAQSGLSDLVKPSGTHCFFIKVEGRVVGQVEVARQDGAWEMVGAGCAPLAQEVHAYQQESPLAPRRFVRIYQAASDFLEVQNGARGGTFLPLASARANLGMPRVAPRIEGQDGGAPSNQEQEQTLIHKLQASVRANLAAHAR